MGGDDQIDEEGATDAGTDSAWMRRHLSDSVYIWGCGEKADDKDDNIKLSDRLIGWLVLFMQAFAYAMLIFLARATSTSEAGSSGGDGAESGFLLPSVTGAMYLLVASTTHDLRSGFSLLVDGTCAGHHAFGMGLLAVYGIMMSAAMTVLVSTSEDSASVVLNAVTVLFVADLDEKALKFLGTVSQEWRLFWAIESIAISFALALIAIIYFGDASKLLEGDNGVLKTFPTWFIWGITPVAVTLCSVLLSSSLQNVCKRLDACQIENEPTILLKVAKLFESISTAMEEAEDCFKQDPCFYVVLGVWLAQTFVTWFFMLQDGYGFPVALYFETTTSDGTHGKLAITDNLLALVYLNAVLAIGLAVKALGYFVPIHNRDTILLIPPTSSEKNKPRMRYGTCASSSVSSLLVGWGLGYWGSSVMYVLFCSWPGGECGWNNAPLIVTAIAYIFFPCFLLASTFMVADVNFLGKRFGAIIKPAVNVLGNWRRVEFWVLASVLRDFLVYWVWLCIALGFNVMAPS